MYLHTHTHASTHAHTHAHIHTHARARTGNCSFWDMAPIAKDDIENLQWNLLCKFLCRKKTRKIQKLPEPACRLAGFYSKYFLFLCNIALCQTSNNTRSSELRDFASFSRCVEYFEVRNLRELLTFLQISVFTSPKTQTPPPLP